jgi:starch synthase
MDKKRILFVSSEVDPFAKTGGLADVAMALPRELVTKGHDIRVVMPKYKAIDEELSYTTGLDVWVGNRNEKFAVRELDVPFKHEGKEFSVKIYFIDSSYYFDRDGMYGYDDDGERFAFFCKSVLEMLPRIDFNPDVLHCNDWHTGPICMLLKESPEYKFNNYFNNIKTIFTIHNLKYQGDFPKDIRLLFNVGEDVFTSEKVELYGKFNYLKAGVAYADLVSTVSENYAKEIQTEYYGEKLDGLLRKRKDELFGIVNGINYEVFNPDTDKKIYKNYSKNNITNKKYNKSKLQKEFNLPEKDVPVISIITRLTEQKGLDLIMHKFEELMNYDIQFIVLGSGDNTYENSFQYFRDKFPEKVGIFLGFNAKLANRIYAGSDMFLMPSRFEPCGLGQLISFRYGTVPIVRQTGGLADTVVDYDGDKESGNGFSFHDFNADDLFYATKRALKVYNNKNEWSDLVKKVMGLDFSWSKSADKYNKLYSKAMDLSKV